jgi:predicted transcriptional regulator
MEVESRQQFKLTKWRMTSVCGRGIIMNTDITKQMEMVLYRTEDDNVTVSALIKDETIWLTQKAMAELFGIDKSGISRHLAKIFETGELDEEVVVSKN